MQTFSNFLVKYSVEAVISRHKQTSNKKTFPPRLTSVEARILNVHLSIFEFKDHRTIEPQNHRSNMICLWFCGTLVYL